MDALALSSMKNTLVDGSDIDNLNQILQPRGMLPLEQGLSKTYQTLDGILDQTTIKRACCMKSPDPENPNNLLIKVRIPTPRGFTPPPGTQVGDIYKKYGFIDKMISVPKSLCGTLGKAYENPRGTGCQNFYSTYCSNIVDEFKKANNGEFNYDVFPFYKPECACFAPMPKYMKDAGVNAPPKCYIPGCEPTQGVYLDPISLSPESDCNLTICQANIDYSQFTAGRDIAIQNKIEQKCGPGAVTTGPGGTTTPASGTGTPAPGTGTPTTGGTTGTPTTGGTTGGPVGGTTGSTLSRFTTGRNRWISLLVCFLLLVLVGVLVYMVLPKDKKGSNVRPAKATNVGKPARTQTAQSTVRTRRNTV